MSKSKVVAAVVLGLTGTLGAGMAQAGNPELQWSVTIGSPVYTQAAPVYVRPLPVYHQPAPVWVQPVPVYHQPAPVRIQPVPVYGRPVVYLQPTRWDRDGDGIPNRHDRLYNPPWDRDGDGIPNRYERRDARGWQGR